MKKIILLLILCIATKAYAADIPIEGKPLVSEQEGIERQLDLLDRLQKDPEYVMKQSFEESIQFKSVFFTLNNRYQELTGFYYNLNFNDFDINRRSQGINAARELVVWQREASDKRVTDPHLEVDEANVLDYFGLPNN